MNRVIPGINIQWPWSQLLLSGDKTVETRSYPIPKKHLGKWLALIETPGPKGHKNGIGKAKITGLIRFSSCFQYLDRSEWEQDQIRHKVLSTDPQYQFTGSQTKWGWVVDSVTRLERPVKPPKKRGIVFASKCRIPI